MNTAGRSEDWTGAQLAERLASLQGVAPEPVEHVIGRVTLHADGHETRLYHVVDEPAPLPQADLPQWLTRHRLRGADRLGLAMLIIRETLDATGLIRECTLEWRRGALDGPLSGDPARVEFTGAARMARFYRVRRDGRLVEVAGTIETLPARSLPAEHFAAEQTAIRTEFGPAARTVDAREPTLLESMVGLASILHVRLADGREIGCGIGWHGPMPFVLAADFPRYAMPLILAPENEAALQALVAEDSLVRHETRLDSLGLAVIARRRGGEALFLLRAEAGTATAVPYEPNPADIASQDQARWMHYAETYEHLTMLDAWQDGDSNDLLAITGDESGQIWRHHIDADGVETWRKPDETAATGLLYRDKLSPGTLAAAEAAGSGPLGLNGLEETESADDVPENSLLAKAEAYVAALAALARGQRAATGPEPLADTLPQIRVLLRAAQRLEADHAVLEARLLLAQVENGRIRPGRLASALARMEARLTDELAATRLVSLTPAQWRHLVSPAPLGSTVERAFPEAAYDVEEAALCLAYRRPSAAAFHCIRIVEAGLAALGTSLKVDERQWPRIMAVLRGTASREQVPLLAALDQVRRCCRGARLAPADKYTEAEAERLFHAVGAFMAEAADAMVRREAG
ncbi:MAG TPA: hypothetical protein VMU81_21685 [Acetobacteraceae bacterium]|jgi:hypothetical protein|nr:hypothetical protein [Acetobacteraceae bacterium]